MPSIKRLIRTLTLLHGARHVIACLVSVCRLAYADSLQADASANACHVMSCLQES